VTNLSFADKFGKKKTDAAVLPPPAYPQGSRRLGASPPEGSVPLDGSLPPGGNLLSDVNFLPDVTFPSDKSFRPDLSFLLRW
jgi:hypothetical protein